MRLAALPPTGPAACAGRPALQFQTLRSASGRPGVPSPGVGAVPTQDVATGLPAPQDGVLLEGSTTPKDPTPGEGSWAALAAAGALGPLPPGPLGAALGEAARAELLQALRRVERGGARFELRTPAMFSFMSPNFEPLTPEQAAARVLSCAGSIQDLMVTRPGQERHELSTLRQLQFLDLSLGAGRSVLSMQDQGHLEVAESLARAGWEGRERYSNQSLGSGELLEGLLAGKTMQLQRGERSAWVSTLDQLRFLDYLWGSGTEHVLLHPEHARGLKQADVNRLSFTRDRYLSDAYQFYTQPSSEWKVALPDGAALPIDWDDLVDLPAQMQRLRTHQQVFDDILGPACERVDSGERAPNFPTVVLGAGPCFTLSVAAGVYAELLVAAGTTTSQALNQVDRLCRALYLNASDDYDLALRAAATARIFADHGLEAALGAIDQTRALGYTRASTPSQRQELEQLFSRQLLATGSLSASVEGFDLVRIPVGEETLDQRMALFLQLAARLPARGRSCTADFYRLVLSERGPQESLESAGRRLVKLMAGMGAGHAPERIREVYAFLQAGLRDGSYGAVRADELVDRFLERLLLHEDVEAALKGLLSEPTVPGGLEQREDSVIVGGVRVKRYQAGSGAK